MKKNLTPKDALERFIPSITDHQINQLQLFADSLLEWNQRYNLISRKDVDRVWEHHLFPSILPVSLFDLPGGCWILDIGSGGGLPAIPIKIIRPDLQLLLVDSVRKKTLFLQKMIMDLQLKDIAIKRERIEALQSDPMFIKKFDIITVRAVAGIPQLIEWSRPFVRANGSILLWKGHSDIPELERTAKTLGLNYEIFSLPEHITSLSGKFAELRFFKIWL